MPEIKNAKITKTFLGVEDHGIFTYYITLDYGDSGFQGFGGYGFDSYDEATRKRRGHAFGCQAILGLLQVLDVNSWEQLVGTPVRVESEFTKVHKIGHYLKDQWLDLKAVAESMGR